MKSALRATIVTSFVMAMLVATTGCDRRQSDWEAARKNDSVEAYGDFLKHYPDGDFVSQAKARLAELQQEEDWKTALAEDTAQGYQQFVERHPQGGHADEARIRVENLNLAAPPAPASMPGAALPSKPGTPAASGKLAASVFRVQLGAFSSETRARSEWQQATKTWHKELAGLGYTIEKAKVGGSTLYRLQTGGVPESRARAICAALQAHHEACVVVMR